MARAFNASTLAEQQQVAQSVAAARAQQEAAALAATQKKAVNDLEKAHAAVGSMFDRSRVAIMGWAQLIGMAEQEGLQNDRIREGIDVIERNVRSQLRLI